MKRRDAMVLGAAGAARLMLPGAAQAVERAGDRRMLVFSGGQPVPVLDPHVRYDWSTRMMQQSIYDALAKYTSNPTRVVPWLAERWESSADGLTWTFHLVGNARFHNGDPVDAEAVRFSYERALKLNKGVAWMLKAYLEPAGIVAVDPRTVRITLNQPYSAFLSFIPLWFIVNPKQVTGEDYGQRFLADGDAGSGPFRIKRWDGQAVMALDAVPDYWRGWSMPEADRPAGVIYRVIREPAPRKAALQRGEVDMVTELTPDDYDQLAKLPGIVVTDDTGMTPFTIQMNTQKGPTADVNFRKALAYAFDYDALLQIENGAAKLLDSPFPDAMTGHVAIPDIPRLDLDRARAYLAKTKWPAGGVELDYTYAAGLEVERRIGLALLESLQKIGIKVNVAAQPWPTLTARGAKPETASDLVAVYVTPVSPDPDVLATQYCSTAAGQYWAMHQLADKQLDDMAAAARLETDSGGAGRFRGGLGVRTRMRKLHDDGLPTLFSVYPEGVGIHTDGLFGGQPGGGVHGLVRDGEGSVVHDCGTGELVTLTGTDRVVEVQLAGGSGFGDPSARARADVERDVADGVVTAEQAAQYGAPARAAE